VCSVSDPRTVSTPLDVFALGEVLRRYGIFEQWSPVLDGLQHGFDVGVKAAARGLETLMDPNHGSCHKDPQFISDYITSEIAAGRYSAGCTPQELASQIGPFRTSPLGLIPKSNSFRLIQDFSFPRDDPLRSSVNSFVNSDDFPTQWGTFDKAAAMILSLPDGCEAATFDISSAYRLTPVSPDQQWALCLFWDGKVYVDHAVPFGLASSAGVFGAVADMLVAIYEASKEFGPIIKWVDDFFVIRFPHQRSTEADFLTLTGDLGVPWNLKKLRSFSIIQRYLGFDWDLRLRTVSMPLHKLSACRELLAAWIAPGASFALHDAEALHGKLVYMSSLFRLIRPFLPSIIHFARSFKSSHSRLHPPSAMVKDLRWVVWLLSVLPPSAPLSYTEPEEVGWWGDASTSFGIGVVIGEFWAVWRWAPGFRPGPGSEFNIGWAEALAVELGLCLLLHLGPRVVRRSDHNHILVRSDNTGVVDTLKKGRSRSTEANKSLKRIHLLLASSGLVLCSRHVTSRDNISDALSRGDVTGFLAGCPGASEKVSLAPPVCLRSMLQSL